MKVSDILKKKGPEVITIHDEKSVLDAVETLAKNRIGGLLVLSHDGKIVGIITERDVLMQCAKDFRSLDKIRIKDVMTKDLVAASPDDEVDHLEAIMIQRRIRHLPIINKKRLVGIVSIGDLVKAQSSESKVEIRYLRDYIEGKYPG